MQPLIIHDRADITATLKRARVESGMTCEAFDHRAGWADRYVAKLEHPDTPSGRQGFHISAMADLWLRALGLRLVLMTEEQAKALNALEAPSKPRPEPLPILPPNRVTVRRMRYARG